MSNELIKPNRLRKRDSILLISPAAGMAGMEALSHRFLNGKKCIENMGFHPLEGSFTNVIGRTAGNPEQRAADILSGFRDPDIKALIATIGGENVCHEIIPHLDFELIRNYPKIILGYSDITSLLLAAYTRSGIVTFYGPTVMPEFGEYPNILEFSRKSFINTLTSGLAPINLEVPEMWTDETLDWAQKLDLTRPRNMYTHEGYIWLKPGLANGRFIGGCIQSLTDLIDRGVNYLPNTDGALFFMESSSKSVGVPYDSSEILSEIEKIKKSGFIDNISALLVGRTPYISRITEQDLNSGIQDIFHAMNIPIALNLPIGHTDPQLTLPIGVQGEVSSGGNYIRVNESGVL